MSEQKYGLQRFDETALLSDARILDAQLPPPRGIFESQARYTERINEHNKHHQALLSLQRTFNEMELEPLRHQTRRELLRRALAEGITEEEVISLHSATLAMKMEAHKKLLEFQTAADIVKYKESNTIDYAIATRQADFRYLMQVAAEIDGLEKQIALTPTNNLKRALAIKQAEYDGLLQK